MDNTEKKFEYSSPLQLTQQFRFCGNPLRVDMYRGCDFGCEYCFANARHYKDGWNKFQMANPENIRRKFKTAFTTDKPGGSGMYELLRHKVPLHCGGMSDPFQAREFEHGLTKELIKISNEYQYPIMFSTKVDNLPEEYFDLLDPKIHAFQISLMGYDEDFVREYEKHTPPPIRRIEFMKKLKSRGFWVSCRIQPLVDIEQAKRLVLELNDTVDYFTVEHMKIPIENLKVQQMYAHLDLSKYACLTKFGRSLELIKDEKINNINALKAISKVPIGCGDNDIHYLSESRCCCGIDTIGEAFDNYLKYNSTYFYTGECNKDELWVPESSVKHIFMSHTAKSYGCEKFRDFVDTYCERYEDLIHP